METGKITSGVFEADEITLNHAETARRLGVPENYENCLIQKCTALVKKEVQPKYCYAVSEVNLEEPDIVNLGFSKFCSKNLYKNLSGCKYAYIMAVTLGIGADRLVSKLAVTSEAESFVADGISSSMAESVINKLSDMLGQSYKLKPRFSAGYGDFGLSVQPEILNFLAAQKLIGITLGENLLMTPKKSITAVQGIIEE